MSVFGKIGRAIAKPFVALGHAMFGKNGIEALKVAVEELLKTQLGGIAWAAVQAASSVANNNLARQTAYDQIKAAAEKAGLEVKDSLVHLSIELLVQHLKEVGVQPTITTNPNPAPPPEQG